MAITLRLKTESYNHRRYSKPYTALIDEDGSIVKFGKWLGSEGYDGELILETPENAYCIVMHGQKDYRGKNGRPIYQIYKNGEAVELEKDNIEYKATISKYTAIERYRELLSNEEK